MKADSRLAKEIRGREFIITAEYSPRAGISASQIEESAAFFKGVTAVNVSDNYNGIETSSLAVSVILARAGIEPVYQLTTRDRNRIALQSDLLGAALLGIKNVLCISGYHQSLIGCADSANVYDIDSIQLLAVVKKMNDENALLDGTKIEGQFDMLAGAVANPYVKPMEMNIMRLGKKIAAGAGFIQTEAVFDVEGFNNWFQTARQKGLTGKTAILAGVLPLTGADEARKLAEDNKELRIPDEVIKRLEAAVSPDAQKRVGLAICAETIGRRRENQGLGGGPILSGEKEQLVPEILSAVKS
jgi:methylenetetrahydrofolate reductase (NADPH)